MSSLSLSSSTTYGPYHEDSLDSTILQINGLQYLGYVAEQMRAGRLAPTSSNDDELMNDHENTGNAQSTNIDVCKQPTDEDEVMNARTITLPILTLKPLLWYGAERIDEQSGRAASRVVERASPMNALPHPAQQVLLTPHNRVQCPSILRTFYNPLPDFPDPALIHSQVIAIRALSAKS